MNPPAIGSKGFKGTYYSETPFLKTDYDNCSFVNCHFLENN